jgi:flagellar biogenesis protein FliO
MNHPGRSRTARPSSLGWLASRWAGGALFPALTACAQGTNNVALHLDQPSITFSLFRVVGALALVFGIFLGGVWLFRNAQKLATARRGIAPKLHILENKSLGPRHGLYVVGYEKQRFLISCGPTGIAFLSALPAAQEVAAEPASINPMSFAEVMARVAGKPAESGFFGKALGGGKPVEVKDP